MATLKAYVGRNVSIAVEQYDVSGHGNELKAKRDAAVIDATGFGDRFEYGLAGIQKSSIELKGHYTPGYAGFDGIVNQRFGQDSDVNVCYGALGWGVLNPVVMQPSVITKYDIDAKLKGAVEIDSVFTARGAVDDGYQLLAPNSYLTGASGVSNVLDDTLTTGATAGGCAAHIHLMSLTGTTPSLAVKLQSSADGTTWADMPGMTFTALTAIGSQRLTLPNGTAIPAFIKASWTLSGTGSPIASAMVGFSRGVVFQ